MEEASLKTDIFKVSLNQILINIKRTLKFVKVKLLEISWKVLLTLKRDSIKVLEYLKRGKVINDAIYTRIYLNTVIKH